MARILQSERLVYRFVYCSSMVKLWTFAVQVFHAFIPKKVYFMAPKLHSYKETISDMCMLNLIEHWLWQNDKRFFVDMFYFAMLQQTFSSAGRDQTWIRSPQMSNRAVMLMSPCQNYILWYVK